MNIESSLYLFISVDVDGSTAYKNKNDQRNNEHPWIGFFKHFYEEYPNTFLRNSLKNQDLCPSVWKSVGDELLFYKKIDNIHTVKEIIKGTIQSIEIYNDKYIKRNFPLGLKATAWIAGFPVINAIIDKIAADNTIDFIGPSIDIGFRISKMSSLSKFYISVELAYILSDTMSSSEYNKFNNIHYSGDIELKGVFNNKPYPAIWIDVGGKCDKIKNNLLAIKKCSKREIVQLTKVFIQDINDPLLISIPYVKNKTKYSYNKPPQKHVEILNNLKKISIVEKKKWEDLYMNNDKEKRGKRKSMYILPRKII